MTCGTPTTRLHGVTCTLHSMHDLFNFLARSLHQKLLPLSCSFPLERRRVSMSCSFFLLHVKSRKRAWYVGRRNSLSLLFYSCCGERWVYSCYLFLLHLKMIAQHATEWRIFDLSPILRQEEDLLFLLFLLRQDGIESTFVVWCWALNVFAPSRRLIPLSLSLSPEEKRHICMWRGWTSGGRMQMLPCSGRLSIVGLFFDAKGQHTINQKDKSKSFSVRHHCL